MPDKDHLAAIAAHTIHKLFNRTWKFESVNCVGESSSSSAAPDNSGSISTNCGYRENPTTKIGSAVDTRVQSGDSVVQLSGSGPYNLYLTFGKSPWVCG